jgi:hypothetical protein
MKINKPIIIIQNTSYHFETTICLYQVLKNLGYNPYIYRYISDNFDQESFISKYQINIATPEIISDAICGFVVSAYPNPIVSIVDSIPNNNDIIFETFKDRLIYICHRFNDEKDYIHNKFINNTNSLSLSSLSNKINIDHITLTHNPITPNIPSIDNRIGITIQGHFGLRGRDSSLFYDLFIKDYTNYQDKIYINILGTKTSRFAHINIPDYIYHYTNMSEIDFYDVLNNKTHWIMSAIDDKTNKSTYTYQRYSSNFIHSLTLQKPIICHQFFDQIYNLPGIYYDGVCSSSMIDTILEAHKSQCYNHMIEDIQVLKNKFDIHNKTIIDKKLSLFF